jgi:putative acetyltransferase
MTQELTNPPYIDEMNLIITSEDATSPIAATLIYELNEELNAMYDTAGGTGDFDPTDVAVPRSAFVIAWVNGAAVGCGAIRPMEDTRHAEVKRMYVRPAFRGRGISRRVLVDLEQRARDFNYRYLQLETGVLQPEAIGLYESAGFYRIPNFGKYVGDEMSVCYRKDL